MHDVMLILKWMIHWFLIRVSQLEFILYHHFIKLTSTVQFQVLIKRCFTVEEMLTKRESNFARHQSEMLKLSKETDDRLNKLSESMDKFHDSVNQICELYKQLLVLKFYFGVLSVAVGVNFVIILEVLYFWEWNWVRTLLSCFKFLLQYLGATSSWKIWFSFLLFGRAACCKVKVPFKS